MAITRRRDLISTEIAHEDFHIIYVTEHNIGLDSGVEFARSDHRRPVYPGYRDNGVYRITNISSEDAHVQAAANLFWTPDVHTTWEAELTRREQQLQ